MDDYTSADSDSGLPIKELPDATKLVCLQGENARVVADMALHKSDLEFSLGCLSAINTLESNIIRPVVE